MTLFRRQRGVGLRSRSVAGRNKKAEEAEDLLGLFGDGDSSISSSKGNSNSGGSNIPKSRSEQQLNRQSPTKKRNPRLKFNQRTTIPHIKRNIYRIFQASGPEGVERWWLRGREPQEEAECEPESGRGRPHAAKGRSRGSGGHRRAAKEDIVNSNHQITS